jgi:diacylglycerol kinase
MSLVIAAEFLNTAIEHLVDICSDGQYHISAKYAKDTAAAAVLCASLTAALVGFFVFVPKLKAMLELIR